MLRIARVAGPARARDRELLDNHSEYAPTPTAIRSAGLQGAAGDHPAVLATLIKQVS